MCCTVILDRILHPVEKNRNRALATYMTVQFSRSLHITFLEPLCNRLINTEELRKRLFISKNKINVKLITIRVL